MLLESERRGRGRVGLSARWVTQQHVFDPEDIATRNTLMQWRARREMAPRWTYLGHPARKPLVALLAF